MLTFPKTGAAFVILVALVVFPVEDDPNNDVVNKGSSCVRVHLVEDVDNHNEILPPQEPTLSCPRDGNDMTVSGLSLSLLGPDTEMFLKVGGSSSSRSSDDDDRCFSLQFKNARSSKEVLSLSGGDTCDQVLAAMDLMVEGQRQPELCLGGDSPCQSDQHKPKKKPAGPAAIRQEVINTVSSAVKLQKQDALYQTYRAKCANFDYDVALYVDVHMIAVCTPRPEAIEAGCPQIAAHSNYNYSTNNFDDELLFWSENQLHISQIYNADSYPIGTYKGLDLIKAYESINLAKETAGDYDIFKNSCASFMISLARALNIKIDARLTAFVTRRLLLNSNEDLMTKIRNSGYLNSLFGGSSNSDDDASSRGQQQQQHYLRTSPNDDDDDETNNKKETTASESNGSATNITATPDNELIEFLVEKSSDVLL